MRVTGDWIEDARTQTVCRVLTEGGYRALFVGGCVRNAILGQPVADIDISTDAVPETVTKLAEDVGLKVVPTGIEHGTVTVVADGLPHEITTFRRDVETDGRRAVVSFTTRIEEDALRRDLTMNALYAGPDGGVVDPLGGLPDLLARRVRFIEDPEARIREDYLRILRFFRFHAWYGDPMLGLDPDGLAACALLAEGLKTLSKERIGAELLKLLSAPDPAPSVASFQKTGGLTRILPGADPKSLPVLVALESDAGLLPDPIRRLASLGGMDHARLLRLSRKDAKQLAVLENAARGQMQAAELGYRLGEKSAIDTLLLRSALTENLIQAEDFDALFRGAAASFPVSAADLVSRFEGPRLGEELRRLEAEWIASGFALSREALLSR